MSFYSSVLGSVVGADVEQARVEGLVSKRRAQQAASERINPYLDLSKQILVPRTSYVEDTEDELRVRRVLLDAGAGTPFWGAYPAAYETVRFAKTIVLPGSAKLSGKAFEQKLQRDTPPGRHGSSIKKLGIQAAKVNITLRMWTQEHLDTFAELVPILKSQRYTTETTTEAVGFTGDAGGAGFTGVVPGTTKTTKRVTPAGPAALDVYHPLLALFKIRSVHILSVSFPEPTGDADVWEVGIECEENRGGASAVTKSDASTELFIEANARIGPTGATRAGIDISSPIPGTRKTKPSDYSSEP